jgi:hypothetical protein
MVPRLSDTLAGPQFGQGRERAMPRFVLVVRI